MGSEVLAIPEESVPDVIRVIRAGLMVEDVPDDVREGLETWCDEQTTFPGDGEEEPASEVEAAPVTHKKGAGAKPKKRSSG